MNTNLSINIAKEEYGKDLVIDLATTKHLLVGGSTGSGKSTLLHKIISTLMTNNSPEVLKFILIDPKRVELTLYTDIPHMLTPAIIDPKKAVLAMKWAGKEIERRFDVLKKHDCKDIGVYHKTVLEPALEKYQKDASNDDDQDLSTLPETMPFVVIVADEFSDLMQIYPKEIQSAALKIAELGQSVGVYIILSTSRMSSAIITKPMQGAIVTRIALQTASVSDSKAIIGTSDAHTLRGKGDMIFREGLKYVIRAQVSPCTYDEAKTLVKSVCERYTEELGVNINLTPTASMASVALGIMAGDDSLETDELYDSAREAVIAAGKASTSYIQRALGIGYSRAAKIMDMLEEGGVIGPANGGEPRKVIRKSE